jgi:DNA-binding LacI/PurR family transcriptional regulator
VLSLPYSAQATLEGTKVAARALGLQLELYEPRNPEAIARAFETARNARLDGLVVLGLQSRQRVVQSAAQYHVARHVLPAHLGCDGRR